ncbi:hypothetical protein H0H81_004039 [Sphagnurus paluster]|uniref:Uncharacterized protein n=1 Tax=Sphagnurus paluster TaxID=117069 RepID=A0A9P7K5D9_9AGAR|nr:hypothetical protein H0H81_004039 [Sphagnurus paluster]
MELVPGGLYVFMTMRAEPGDCHWGLYLHHTTTTATNAKSKSRVVHKGKKYHVRNPGSEICYMPAHEIVSDMLSTLFLVGLLRIGTIDIDVANPTAIRVVDAIITALDAQVYELSRGNSIYCRTWVVGTIRALLSAGHLRTVIDATDAEVWAHIQRFGEAEWAGAEKAVQPRPIATFDLFVV